LVCDKADMRDSSPPGRVVIVDRGAIL
jgi:hypothetical protein